MVMIKGKPVMLEGATSKARREHKAWRDAVALFSKSARARQGRGDLVEGPLDVTLDFTFTPPKSQAKKKSWVDVKPDIDKLVRSTLDGMTGILFKDDSQVCRLEVTKKYSLSEENGCAVRVVPLTHHV